MLYCSSFSKTLAPGYRVGWVIARQYHASVLTHKHALTLCNPTLPQVALANFLQTGGYDRHLRRLRRRLADNVDGMIRAVGDAFPPGTRATRPQGGFVIWLELPQPVATSALFDRALSWGIARDIERASNIGVASNRNASSRISTSRLNASNASPTGGELDDPQSRPPWLRDAIQTSPQSAGRPSGRNEPSPCTLRAKTAADTPGHLSKPGTRLAKRPPLPDAPPRRQSPWRRGRG